MFIEVIQPTKLDTGDKISVFNYIQKKYLVYRDKFNPSS